MKTTMDFAQFTEALDRWGPDFEQWPAGAASAGRMLYADSTSAQEARRRAETAARVLLAPAPDVAALKARILAAARVSGRVIRDNVVPFPTRLVVAPAAFALAASLLVGIFAGWTGMIGDPLASGVGEDAPSYEFQAFSAGENYDS